MISEEEEKKQRHGNKTSAIRSLDSLGPRTAEPGGATQKQL